MRGGSLNGHHIKNRLKVFPAYAGVILTILTESSSLRRLSRVCGGDPVGLYDEDVHRKSFPRMRG